MVTKKIIKCTTSIANSLLVSSLIYPSFSIASTQRIGIEADWTYADDACQPHHLNCDKTSPGISALYRYQFNLPYYLEAGYHYLGRYHADYPALQNPQQVSPYEGSLHSLDLSGGYLFKVADRHSIALSLGAMAWRTKDEGAEYGQPLSRKDTGVSPTLALGWEYDLSSDWIASAKYRFTPLVGGTDTGGATLHTLSLGLHWRFGRSAEPISRQQQPVPELMPVAVATVPQLAEIITVKEYSLELGGSDSTVYFKFDSAELMPAMAERLQPMLERLSHYPSAALVIESHTDSKGSDSYNQKLSERRGDSVKSYFAEQGIDSERISVQAFGESKPLVSNDSAENRAMNRRVKLVSPSFDMEVTP
ncbi:OmpA family protein [Vibrio sp.]|uniref:OmpA family protein n=1 Tax=Vibrio sp. TaxID=678 RepID=UPI003D101182